jgi:hypothetical protein
MAALLNEKRPGWRDELDIERIDFYSLTNCVLGQLYGDYSLGVEALEPDFVDDRGMIGDNASRWTVEHAVEIPVNEPRDYTLLSDAWQNYLRGDS